MAVRPLGAEAARARSSAEAFSRRAPRERAALAAMAWNESSRAIEDRPDFVPARQLRASLLGTLGRSKEAEHDWLLAVEFRH